jgi:predicted metal-dependent peptidase
MVNISSKKIQALFEKIRINFLFNHPFLSVLALSIPTNYETNTYSAFESDGFCITIDLEKLSKYSDDEISYLYAHVLLHIVLKHPSRVGAREKKLWNQSCDIVVNLILDSFDNVGKMPDDEIFDMEFKDKSVEEVYEILDKQEEEKEDDGSDEDDEESQTKTSPDKKGELKAFIYDSSKLDIAEVENKKTDSGDMEKLEGTIIQALSIAKSSSHKYAGLAIEIDTIIKPQISLHDILKEYLSTSLFEKHTTFARPNRKFIHSGLYLPGSKKSDELIEVYIALDSSSSVSLEEYKKFLGIISEVCEGFYEYKVTIIPFDKFVKEEHIISFDSFNEIIDEKLFIPKSDGGTNFNEVIRYLKKSDIREYNLLLVLSDGEFELSVHLLCHTLFIINDKKNLSKFESISKAILLTD